MIQAIYIKAPPSHTIYNRPHLSFYVKRFLSVTFVFIGIVLLTTVIYPLVHYQLTIAPTFSHSQLLNPSPHLSTPVSAKPPQVLPELHSSLDYTNPANWFPSYHPSSSPTPHSISYFNLSIPKLDIKSALVKIGGQDLKKSLIHYQGTALPGSLGNTVIFGHSVLPQFFNPNNYLTIFSTLHTLSKGDEIIVNYDNVTYTYNIIDMYEVEPSDLSPLLQTYDNSYLTLITCTPPGTYLRRLIVKAILMP